MLVCDWSTYGSVHVAHKSQILNFEFVVIQVFIIIGLLFFGYLSVSLFFFALITVLNIKRISSYKH